MSDKKTKHKEIVIFAFQFSCLLIPAKIPPSDNKVISKLLGMSFHPVPAKVFHIR